MLYLSVKSGPILLQSITSWLSEVVHFQIFVVGMAATGAGLTFQAQNGTYIPTRTPKERLLNSRGSEGVERAKWSDGLCFAQIHMGRRPSPSCASSLAHSPSPSTRESVFLHVSCRHPSQMGQREGSAHIAKGDHLHRPTYARVSVGCVVMRDLLTMWIVGRRSAHVVRDVERSREDPHKFVQSRWVGESSSGQLQLFFRVSSLVE